MVKKGGGPAEPRLSRQRLGRQSEDAQAVAPALDAAAAPALAAPAPAPAEPVALDLTQKKIDVTGAMPPPTHDALPCEAGQATDRIIHVLFDEEGGDGVGRIKTLYRGRVIKVTRPKDGQPHHVVKFFFDGEVSTLALAREECVVWGPGYVTGPCAHWPEPAPASGVKRARCGGAAEVEAAAAAKPEPKRPRRAAGKVAEPAAEPVVMEPMAVPAAAAPVAAAVPGAVAVPAPVAAPVPAPAAAPKPEAEPEPRRSPRSGATAPATAPVSQLASPASGKASPAGWRSPQQLPEDEEAPAEAAPAAQPEPRAAGDRTKADAAEPEAHAKTKHVAHSSAGACAALPARQATSPEECPAGRSGQPPSRPRPAQKMFQQSAAAAAEPGAARPTPPPAAKAARAAHERTQPASAARAGPAAAAARQQKKAPTPYPLNHADETIRAVAETGPSMEGAWARLTSALTEANKSLGELAQLLDVQEGALPSMSLPEAKESLLHRALWLPSSQICSALARGSVRALDDKAHGVVTRARAMMNELRRRANKPEVPLEPELQRWLDAQQAGQQAAGQQTGQQAGQQAAAPVALLQQAGSASGVPAWMPPDPAALFKSTGDRDRDDGIRILLSALCTRHNPGSAAIELEQQLWLARREADGRCGERYLRTLRMLWDTISEECTAHRPLLKYMMLNGQLHPSDLLSLTPEQLRDAEARCLEHLANPKPSTLGDLLKALPPPAPAAQQQQAQQPVAAAAPPAVMPAQSAAAAAEAMAAAARAVAVQLSMAAPPPPPPPGGQ